MTNSQILQDFFNRWSAVSVSRFALDIGVHRNTLNQILKENKEPSTKVWLKIKAGLKKYGYSLPS